MTFEEAVVKINNKRIKYYTGLQAMGADSKYIKASDNRKLCGSINIDKSLEDVYPNENRWDYSLGYDNRAYFVEIHPAYTSEVNTVLKKLAWLKKWLSVEGKTLDAIKSDLMPFRWVYTSKCSIPKNTRQYRAAAQNGIVPIRELEL